MNVLVICCKESLIIVYYRNMINEGCMNWSYYTEIPLVLHTTAWLRPTLYNFMWIWAMLHLFTVGLILTCHILDWNNYMKKSKIKSMVNNGILMGSLSISTRRAQFLKRIASWRKRRSISFCCSLFGTRVKISIVFPIFLLRNRRRSIMISWSWFRVRRNCRYMLKIPVITNKYLLPHLYLLAHYRGPTVHGGDPYGVLYGIVYVWKYQHIERYSYDCNEYIRSGWGCCCCCSSSSSTSSQSINE